MKWPKEKVKNRLEAVISQLLEASQENQRVKERCSALEQRERDLLRQVEELQDLVGELEARLNGLDGKS